MKQSLLFAILFLAIAATSQAQEVTLRIPIIKTETVTEDVEDENDEVIGSVTFDASSDDAEQENDGIDALFDDDLDAGWQGSDGDANVQTVGLRFQNVSIPKGAKIDSAYILVYSHESKTSEDVALLSIYAEDTDSAATFTEDVLITDRTATTAKVDWTVDEEWGLWTEHSTPNLSAIVQEIVDRDGWKPGNAIAFILAGAEGSPSEVENAREFESFENIADPEDGGDGQNHPERVPALIVHFSIDQETAYEPSTNAALNFTILKTETVTEDVEDKNDQVIGTITFDASSDDAEQENDEMDALFDDDIDAGWEGADGDANTLTCGLRFQNITIPKGATIDSAFIYVYSHEAKSAEDVAKLTIYGDAADSSVTFSEDALITDRTATSANVKWTIDQAWGLWTAHRTPDLKSVVQEIINRDGWKSGNALAFVMQGEDQGPSEFENAREFESFENIADPEDGGDGQNHPERVPQLVIYYGGYAGPAIAGQGDIISDGTETLSSEVEQIRSKIYPNPAAEYINVILPNSTLSTISVLSLSGQTLIHRANTNGQKDVKLDVSTLESGVYLVSVKQSGKTLTQRLIIQ